MLERTEGNGTQPTGHSDRTTQALVKGVFFLGSNPFNCGKSTGMHSLEWRIAFIKG